MDTALLPPLATRADYAAIAGPEPVGLDIEALLNAASALIRAYCGWHICPVITEDMVVNGSGSTLVMLPTGALRSVSAVSDKAVPLDLSLLSFSSDGRLQRESSSPFGYPQLFSRTLGGLVVTATHGFDSVPDVASLAVTMAARAAANPSGMLHEQAGGIQVAYSQADRNIAAAMVLLPHEQALLGAYRLPRFR